MNQARVWTLLTAAVAVAGVLVVATQRTPPRSRTRLPRASWIEHRGGWGAICVI